MEGLLSLFEAEFPHGDGDPRSIGFNVGKQVVGLYIVEMLLKYALEGTGRTHGSHHNLHELFRNIRGSSARQLRESTRNFSTAHPSGHGCG